MGAVLLLAACGVAPLAIDLLPLLGDDASGSRSVVADGDIEFRLPGDEGQALSGYETLGVRPAAVDLVYRLELSRDGNLAGEAFITFYLAAPGANLWSDDNRLGEAQRLDLQREIQEIAGTLSLSRSQIEALVSGEIVIGAMISGNASGSASIGYSFKQLTLKVAFF